MAILPAHLDVHHHGGRDEQGGSVHSFALTRYDDDPYIRSFLD